MDELDSKQADSKASKKEYMKAWSQSHDRSAYMKEYRRKKLESGLCVNCGKNPRFAKCTFCETCRQSHITKTKARLAKMKEIGLCVYCGKKKDEKSILCSACRTAKNKRESEKRALNHDLATKKEREYTAKKMATDAQYKMRSYLRRRICCAIRKGLKGGSAVRDLGCSMPEFIRYIEGQFSPGMNWGNWGLGEGKWHLDHIVPLRSFDLQNREEFLLAAHFTNYQPLWQEDNYKKSDWLNGRQCRRLPFGSRLGEAG